MAKPSGWVENVVQAKCLTGKIVHTHIHQNTTPWCGTAYVKCADRVSLIYRSSLAWLPSVFQLESSPHLHGKHLPGKKNSIRVRVGLVSAGCSCEGGQPYHVCVCVAIVHYKFPPSHLSACALADRHIGER